MLAVKPRKRYPDVRRTLSHIAYSPSLRCSSSFRSCLKEEKRNWPGKTWKGRTQLGNGERNRICLRDALRLCMSTHPPTHRLTVSLTHWLTESLLLHWLTDLLTLFHRLTTVSLTDWLTDYLTYSLTNVIVNLYHATHFKDLLRLCHEYGLCFWFSLKTGQSSVLCDYQDLSLRVLELQNRQILRHKKKNYK